jgi:threonine/homoserine/homoserine lactone efflux protein
MQLLLDLPSTGRAQIAVPGKARQSPSDLVILAILGVRYLLWAVGERIRAWHHRPFAARRAKPSVICLAPYAPRHLQVQQS